MTEDQFLQHLEAAEATAQANPEAVTLHTLAGLIDALATLVPHLEPEVWGWYDLRIGNLSQARAGTRNLADHGHELDEASARLQAMLEAASQF